MGYYPAGGQTYTLGSSISSTDTSILLSSFTEPVSGTPYTMALLNTDIVYATIAPRTSNSEFISFTGITQNANGTATLTGVTRGLAKKYPFTTSATFKLPHAGQSQFILSDAPQVFAKYGALDNDEVIIGQWEAPNPLTAQGLVTRDYMLALINGGAISVDAVTEAGIAGETIAENELIYFSETENEWMKTDADTLATLFNVKLGIAQGAGTNGNSITGGVTTLGTFTITGATKGDLLYASNTAGGVNSGTSGTIPRVIGIAVSSTVGYFDPNFQNRLYDYAVDSVGTDSYAVTMPGSLSIPFVGMEINFKAGTANTGACTLAINGGSAISIVKNVSDALTTGDISANQLVKVIYNGTNFQLLSPTNSLNANTNPVVRTYLNAASPATWTKPTGLKYVTVEVQAAGGTGADGTDEGATGKAGGGGGGGGYSKKLIAVASLGATETVTIGAVGNSSSFGTHLSATAGSNGSGRVGGAGGTGSSGDINLGGSDGATANLSSASSTTGGQGGNSFLGGGGKGGYGASGNGSAGKVYGGGGGGGGAVDAGTMGTGGTGAEAIVIVTEYYS